MCFLSTDSTASWQTRRLTHSLIKDPIIQNIQMHSKKQISIFRNKLLKIKFPIYLMRWCERVISSQVHSQKKPVCLNHYKKLTNVGISKIIQKSKRIKRREITAVGFPSPLENINGVGFVSCNAIPPFEYLLACVVVPRRRSDRRIVDPSPIRVIAVAVNLLRRH